MIKQRLSRFFLILSAVAFVAACNVMPPQNVSDNGGALFAKATNPNKTPSGGPTKTPTAAPTKTPTGVPTKTPTPGPTKTPTPVPTKTPTPGPTTSGTIQIFIASDSTASLYAADKYPRMGWGQPFGMYFKSNIVIKDTAKSGASSTSFQTEPNYADIKSQIKAGDYLLIQFGHNDENSNPAATTFTTALKVYVAYARSVGANPILITPVQRRHFNADGTMKNSHITSAGGDYPQAVRDVASSQNVPLIDLTARSMTFFQGIGDAGSKAYYLYVAASEGFPGYPSGTSDDTHFREKGAIAVGQLVVDGLRALNSPLVQYLK